MKTLIERYALPRLLALFFSAMVAFQPAAFGQGNANPEFTQQELDQMLAPIALYPDPLLSQILMASTYPLEVVEAARWSRAHRGLRGDQAVRAVADKDWDPSVKSLVAFPQILAMMDQKLEWTERLGDAFLAQEPQVMDTVQDLRHRADVAGNLRSNDRIRVDSQGRIIVIEPVSPRYVYVPYYDPLLVYGPWWWPAYPPVYWAPWSGYYVSPGYAGFAWGSGIGISAGFFFGAFDWPQRHARIVTVNNYYYRPRTVIVNREINASPGVARNVNVAPGVWQHDPAHRRGTPYRVEAVRERFARSGTAAEARRDFRGNQPAPAPAPAPAARSRQDMRPDVRGAETQARTRDNAAPVVPPSQPTVERRRDSPRPDTRSRPETRPEMRSAETPARTRENAAPNGNRQEKRDAAPRPDTRGAAAPEERRRDARATPPSQPTVERRRDTPAAAPSQPAVERRQEARTGPSSQPTVERRREAPAPLPRAIPQAPQVSANAPAQRQSGNDRGSSDAARPHEKNADKHEKK